MPPLPPATALAPLRPADAGPRALESPRSSDAGAAHFRALLEGEQNSPGAIMTQAPAPNPGPTDALRAFYQEANTQSRALEGIIAEARAGRSFSTQEIIGLQARIYRSTLILQTFSKGVESTAGAARQLLGTQL